jgi:hypothetical protein
MKDGQIMQGGPDHYARLAATKRFGDLLDGRLRLACIVEMHPLGYYLPFRGRHALAGTSG